MPSRWRLSADEAWSKGIKEYLEGSEERLPEHIVQANKFEMRWEVGINTILAEVFVVFDMVFLKDNSMVNDRWNDSKNVLSI